MAVKNRIVVPLLATNRSACSTGGSPPQPFNRHDVPALFDLQAEPAQRFDHHLSVFAVEGARSMDVPSASAAQISARFVMLLDPGGRSWARRETTGWIST